MLKGGGYEKSALQTPFPELHAQKKSRLICLTIGRVDRTMFLKGTIVTNQAAHGMVTHQAAPGYKIGYSIFSCQEQGVYYTPLHLKTG